MLAELLLQPPEMPSPAVFLLTPVGARDLSASSFLNQLVTPIYLKAVMPRRDILTYLCLRLRAVYLILPFHDHSGSFPETKVPRAFGELFPSLLAIWLDVMLGHCQPLWLSCCVQSSLSRWHGRHGGQSARCFHTGMPTLRIKVCTEHRLRSAVPHVLSPRRALPRPRGTSLGVEGGVAHSGWTPAEGQAQGPPLSHRHVLSTHCAILRGAPKGHRERQESTLALTKAGCIWEEGGRGIQEEKQGWTGLCRLTEGGARCGDSDGTEGTTRRALPVVPEESGPRRLSLQITCVPRYPDLLLPSRNDQAYAEVGGLTRSKERTTTGTHCGASWC